MRQRIIYLDNLKCFAILLVMMCHGTMFLSYSYIYDNPLLLFVHSVQMPLFMALCGYFFRKSLKLKTIPFIKKKFVALMVPALAWSFIKFVIHGGAIFYGWYFMTIGS